MAAIRWAPSATGGPGPVRGEDNPLETGLPDPVGQPLVGVANRSRQLRLVAGGFRQEDGGQLESGELAEDRHPTPGGPVGGPQGSVSMPNSRLVEQTVQTGEST